MRRILGFSGALVVLLSTGCGKAPDLGAEQAAIRRVDAELVSALNARDVDRWLTFFTADAKMMPPGAPPVEGKDAIRKLVAELLTIPEFSVAHHLESVEVSRGADLAWVSYAYELTVRDSQGKTVHEKGKDVSVYRKLQDGSWRVVIDMWSENQPPAPPS